jgi:hypothetical protein
MSDLHKEVEDPANNAELVALKRRIDAFQILYVVLFVASLALLLASFQTSVGSVNVLWALSLGGAVLVRVIRSSWVSKYNTLINGGRPGPLQ